MQTQEIKIVSGYVPGAIGRITELQAKYYAEHWNLGLYFEAKHATELAVFMSRYNPAQDGAWLAMVGGEIVGGIFIDGNDLEGPRLRWFILDPAYQGHGIGNRLMTELLAFCKKA